jgi:probable rRNA maturation factor
MEELTIPNHPDIPKNIIIKNTTKRHLPLTYGVLKRCARNTLRLSGNKRDGLFLGISFFSDSRIKKLNQKYLKTNTPTDVIAFSYSKDNADIAISLDTAKRNAGIYKNSLKKEILLYIIHGILHLSGYDDTTPKEKKRMFKKQEEILNKIIKH